jgi:DNA-binding transcriptional regulator of glucitol operon
MRKYFTRRCLWIHLLALIVVPTCFFLGKWQYDAARSGNTLSWAYTIEWPLFGIYAIYTWWQLIHDQRTAFDRLWAAKQRSATEASGRPLQQIPGWALDKSLSKAVTEASLGPDRAPELSSTSPAPVPIRRQPELADPDSVTLTPYDGEVIDADVLDSKVEVDEELVAYNRYLAELSWEDPPKRW